MKTHSEETHYKRLKAKMISKCDSMGYSWATYYATLLSLKGNNAEQMLRNFFNDTNKRFNGDQMALICNDLEDLTHIKPFKEHEIKTELLNTMAKIGKVSQDTTDCLNGDGEIDEDEINCINTRELLSTVTELHWRVEETKAQF